MLNHGMGAQREVSGRNGIETSAGRAGHAVYGPYERLDAGRYAVEFHLAPLPGQDFGEDVVCAIVDIAVEHGKALTSRDIRLSELAGGRTAVQLTFELSEPRNGVEYRIWATGAVPLLIDVHRSIAALSDGENDGSAALARMRFPIVTDASPAFLKAQETCLRQYHERGVGVRVQDGDVVLSIRGVTFHARCLDDLNFINEIFYESAYGLKTGNDTCVVDVGMNIGLASLLLATNPRVREIHSFEPFRETFERATANLTLNPALAEKISPHNIGLSDSDEDAVITVSETFGDSGGASTRSVEGGRPAHIVLKDTATALRPIIAAARARGRDVILKIDCEGGEFAVFRRLEEGGLLQDVTALMVEWHRIFADKSGDDLIEPLKRAGFVVFDLTRPTGNGFFYAARVDRTGVSPA